MYAFIVTAKADLPNASARTAVTARTINTGPILQSRRNASLLPTACTTNLSKRSSPMHGEMESRRPARRDDWRWARWRPSKSSKEWKRRCRRRSPQARKLLTGGNRTSPDREFYEPTVLVDVPRESRDFAKKCFGPVAAIMRVKNNEESN